MTQAEQTASHYAQIITSRCPWCRLDARAVAERSEDEDVDLARWADDGGRHVEREASDGSR